MNTISYNPDGRAQAPEFNADYAATQTEAEFIAHQAHQFPELTEEARAKALKRVYQLAKEKVAAATAIEEKALAPLAPEGVETSKPPADLKQPLVKDQGPKQK